MVTIKPKAAYQSMYAGARAATPRSIRSKSSSRLNAAMAMTTSENPIPRMPVSQTSGAENPKRLRTIEIR